LFQEALVEATGGMADDSGQWTVWFDRHSAALILLARQWAPSRADAEDIVQEAFIRFWRSRQRVEEPAAYLYACVKHCALDWQRGRKRQARREEATARPEVETLFADSLVEQERGAAIEAALHGLPEDQREVLVMKIWGELSFPQIAAALAVSANTAASRYRYALAKLREQLAEEPIP
jgi:RNA polymerase sigma-70 factor (ECF subfamily)